LPSFQKQAHGAPTTLQVIDLISLKPFDMEAITNSVHKTKRVIIVEECMKTGGIGASLSATINESCFDHLDHQVRRRSCPGASVAAGWVTEGRSVIVLAGIAPCGFRASQSVRNHADKHCWMAAGGAAQLPGCTNSVCVRAGGSHHCTARAGQIPACSL
jgi:Transketolase, C-terminal domain